MVRVGASSRARRSASRRRADERRQRVAREERHVGDGAALDPVFRPKATLGIDVAGEVAVVSRVGVEDATHRSALGRHLGLDPAPRTAVARDHDLAFDVDSPALELFVVVGHAVVDVHQLSPDVTIDRVGIEGRQSVGLFARVLAHRDLFEGGGELRRCQQLDEARLRGREEHLELFDPRVVAPGAKQLRHEFGVRLAVERAHVVWLRRHALHP